MTCQKCGEEADELFAVKIERKRKKYCEECYDVFKEQQEIAEEAQGAMKELMGYKGGS